MAVPIVESSANNRADGNATLTITKPTGVVSGDLMVAALCYEDTEGYGSTGITGPSGWTKKNDVLNSTTRYQTWEKIAGGSEGASYSWTNTAKPGMWSGGIVRISGHDPSSYWNTSGTSSLTNSTVTSSTSPSVTTTVDDCLILVTCHNNLGGYASANATRPSGYTSIWGNYTSDTTRSESAAAYTSKATAGATGTHTWTTLDSALGAVDYIFGTIAIAPAAAAAGHPATRRFAMSSGGVFRPVEIGRQGTQVI